MRMRVRLRLVGYAGLALSLSARRATRGSSPEFNKLRGAGGDVCGGASRRDERRLAGWTLKPPLGDRPQSSHTSLRCCAHARNTCLSTLLQVDRIRRGPGGDEWRVLLSFQRSLLSRTIPGVGARASANAQVENEPVREPEHRQEIVLFIPLSQDLEQVGDGRPRVRRYRSLDLRLGRELLAFRIPIWAH